MSPQTPPGVAPARHQRPRRVRPHTATAHTPPGRRRRRRTRSPSPPPPQVWGRRAGPAAGDGAAAGRSCPPPSRRRRSCPRGRRRCRRLRGCTAGWRRGRRRSRRRPRGSRPRRGGRRWCGRRSGRSRRAAQVQLRPPAETAGPCVGAAEPLRIGRSGRAWPRRCRTRWPRRRRRRWCRPGRLPQLPTCGGAAVVGAGERAAVPGQPGAEGGVALGRAGCGPGRSKLRSHRWM